MKLSELVRFMRDNGSSVTVELAEGEDVRAVLLALERANRAGRCVFLLTVDRASATVRQMEVDGTQLAGVSSRLGR
jgi:hypothetical protein